MWHCVAHKHRRLIAKGEMDNDLNASLKQPTNSPLHCWIRAQFIVIEAGKLSLLVDFFVCPQTKFHMQKCQNDTLSWRWKHYLDVTYTGLIS